MSRDKTKLNPKLQAKVNELQALCDKEGLNILFTDCLRTKEEQQACVDRGTSKVVYPKSQHNWGNAIDFCYNKKGEEYKDINFFKKVGKLAKSIGLVWGGDFTNVDYPHLQLGDYGVTCDKLIKEYGTPDKFMKTWNTTTTATTIKKGDKVKVLKNKTYTNTKFNVYYNQYDVIQVNGDRVVIGIGNTVTCAIHIDNIERV